MVEPQLDDADQRATDDRFPRLFVYGTLKRGCERHDLLRRIGARYLASGTIEGELYSLGDFPGAFPRSGCAGQAGGSTTIPGELYRLPGSQALAVLDAYEGIRPGHRSLYRRELSPVLLEGGGRVQAWVYWLERVPPGAIRIPSWKLLQGG